MIWPDLFEVLAMQALVARAGVPMRRPEASIGGRGSKGTALRLTVDPDLVQPVLGLLAAQFGPQRDAGDEREVHVGAAGEHIDALGGRAAIHRRVRVKQHLGDR